MKNSIALIAAGMLLVAGVLLIVGFRFFTAGRSKTLTVPFYNTADCTPIWLHSPEEEAARVPHRIANFTMTDQTGTTVTQASIEGRIHVADFIFTSCSSLCPAMSHQFKLLQDSLMNDSNVTLLSYSVTPWIDTVGRLKEYAETIGARSDKWHLLTGDKAQIYDLARTSYFAEGAQGYAKDSAQFLHTEHFILVDKSLRVRGIYNGTLPLERGRLLADIHAIEREE